ncbi:MAG: hypothetical protein ACLRZ7_00870 [Lachnospiraceae bacterium]
MNANDLKEWILSMLQDINIEYNGMEGCICPFSQNNISITFNEETRGYTDIEELMSDPFIDGRPLTEISEKLTLY